MASEVLALRRLRGLRTATSEVLALRRLRGLHLATSEVLALRRLRGLHLATSEALALRSRGLRRGLSAVSPACSALREPVRGLPKPRTSA